MHEVSIAHSIIQMIEEIVPQDKKGHVSAVNINVGQLSAIETQALLFAFDIVKAKTRLSKAALHITSIEGRGWCSDCGQSFPMQTYATPCSNCDSYRVKIMQGKEMKVMSYDFEEEK